MHSLLYHSPAALPHSFVPTSSRQLLSHVSPDILICAFSLSILPFSLGLPWPSSHALVPCARRVAPVHLHTRSCLLLLLGPPLAFLYISARCALLLRWLCSCTSTTISTTMVPCNSFNAILYCAFSLPMALLSASLTSLTSFRLREAIFHSCWLT